MRHKIYNIGNNKPLDTLLFVEKLIRALIEEGVIGQDIDIKSNTQLIESQAGDVQITYADIDDLKQEFDWQPQTDVENGLRIFAKWYEAFRENL